MESILSFFLSSMKAGTPLLLASLGEIYAERSGVLNLGIEGMMSIGALAAFLIAYQTGDPYLGILASILFGATISLVHAFVSVSLRAEQVVSGLALAFLGLGISGFLGRPMVGQVAPSLPMTLAGELTLIEPLALGLSALLWFILFKTRWGLIIRAVGEDPKVADSSGINVFLVRYVCIAVGGALSGLAGAYISLVYTPHWAEGVIAGRGWIALALTIFSMWDPIKAVAGAYLFGGVEVLGFRLQALGFRVPTEILSMLPYALTIIVLVILYGSSLRVRIGAPSALGVPYSREQ